MFFPWVRRGLRTGVLTTRYPAVHEAMAEEFRGRPVLHAARCLAGEGCTACTQVCLPQALRAVAGEDEETPRQITLDYTRCIMCGLCISACPAQALTMSQDYELAATQHEDLVQRVIFVHPSTSESEVHS